jgi:hypothetical protein
MRNFTCRIAHACITLFEPISGGALPSGGDQPCFLQIYRSLAITAFFVICSRSHLAQLRWL